MDVLSEVLKAVKLDGAVFFNGEFSSPWCAWEPDAGTMASYLAAGAGHIIIFHLILEGRAYARVEEDGSAVPLVAGDIVIVPHGDAHLMGNGPPVAPIDSAAQLRQVLAEGRMISQFGGGGELTKLICGYMTCDPQLSRIVMAGLPPIIKVHIRDSPSGQWLEDTLRYSVDQAEACGPGAALSPNYPRHCSWKRCGVISRSCRAARPDGWPECAIRTWEKRWRCCIDIRPAPGPSRPLPEKSESPAPCSPNISSTICRIRRSAI